MVVNGGSGNGNGNGNHDLPFAKELFEAANGLRGSVESAEYKHLVLGLLFLKYISDAFERRRAWLDAATRDEANLDYYCVDDVDREATLEDRDEYISENVFWVPERPDGRRSWPPRLSPTSASASTVRSTRLSTTTPNSFVACCPRSMPAHRSSPRGSGRSWTPSQRSGSATIRSEPATSLAARTSTSQRVRPRRRPPRRRVLHPSLGRPPAGRNARAVRGSRLRPRGWLRWPFRPVGSLRGGPRRPRQADLDPRPGEQPGNLADLQDEPRDSRPRR